MSVFRRIATKLLDYGKRRDGPTADVQLIVVWLSRYSSYEELTWVKASTFTLVASDWFRFQFL